MNYDEIKLLVDEFERKVSSAWIYDTKLEFDECYNPKKLVKAEQLMDELSKSKVKLLAAIKEFIQ